MWIGKPHSRLWDRTISFLQFAFRLIQDLTYGLWGLPLKSFVTPIKRRIIHSPKSLRTFAMGVRASFNLDSRSCNSRSRSLLVPDLNLAEDCFKSHIESWIIFKERLNSSLSIFSSWLGVTNFERVACWLSALPFRSFKRRRASIKDFHYLEA